MNKNPKTLHPTPYTLHPKSGGYALLLSVLISGLILSIGLGLLSIVEKKITLSSLGRESQRAFYAADSGAECGLYWDRTHGGFPMTVFATSSLSIPPTTPTSGVLCVADGVGGGQDIAANWVISGADTETANTSFELTFANGSCATVVIGKTNEGRQTVVSSRGHNTCDLNFPRIIERAIRILY